MVREEENERKKDFESIERQKGCGFTAFCFGLSRRQGVEIELIHLIQAWMKVPHVGNISRTPAKEKPDQIRFVVQTCLLLNPICSKPIDHRILGLASRIAEESVSLSLKCSFRSQLNHSGARYVGRGPAEFLSLLASGNSGGLH